MCAHGLCPPPPHGEANNRGREDRGEKEGAVPVEQIGGVPRVSAAGLPLCCGWLPGAGVDAGAEEVAAEWSGSARFFFAGLEGYSFCPRT